MIRFHNLTSEAYKQARFDALKKTEGSKDLPYLDSKQIPTIGVGFNLKVSGNQDEVFEKFGIDPDNGNLSSEAKATEQYYKNQLINKINNTYANNTELQNALDKIMADRAKDPLLSAITDRRSTFSFANENEIREVFDTIIPKYETLVDNWLASIPESEERAALVSLTYNTPALLGPKLKRAVAEGDRADAWYEIRYNSNGNDLKGIAKRRYYEVDMFGLWDGDKPSWQEMREFGEMLWKHWKEISAYDEKWGKIDPNDGVQSALEMAISEFLLNEGNATLKGIFSKIGINLDTVIKQLGSLGRALQYFGITLTDSPTFAVCHQSFTTASGVNSIPPNSSPLILDLDGDGIETTLAADGAYFDHDGNGFAEQTGWSSSDDGILVWDRNNDGRINDGKELFGDQTLLKNGSRASNGFQALAEWDDNKNGKIDVNDSIWSNLKIWQDFDGDGYSAADELRSLSDLGISSINTGYTNSNFVDPQGNEHRQVGNFSWGNGTTGTAADVWFKTDKMYTIANEWLDISSDIAALPDLQGFGNVYDLQQAMVRGTSGLLRSLVEQFMAATEPKARNNLMDQILFKWTDSDGITPTSRGPYIDARVLAVLEKFFGQTFVGLDGPNPNINAGPLLNQSYRGVFEMFYGGLMAQTHLKDFYDKITYTWDEATQSLKGDLTAVKTELENRYSLDPILGESLASEFIRTIKGFQAEAMVGLDTLRSNRTFSWLIDSYGPQSQIYGTGANDSLVGTVVSDGIRGGDGADTIYGDAGDDILLGQAGNDVLDGGAGADTLIGGAGDDILGGSYGTTDYLSYDKKGNIYEGGPGNDTLRGTFSGDLYKFNLGDGQDVIQESPYYQGWGSTLAPTGTDILRFGPGISPSDIQVVRVGNDLVFKHINGTDQVKVQSWYGGSYYQLERVEFVDGTVWNGNDLTAQGLIVSGTEGNDLLLGVEYYNDTLYGLGGNDTLYGYGSNDYLNGGSGDDILDGGAGSDALIGGPGNDVLGGMNGSPDHRNSGPGGNIYEGGPGNDTLRGTLNGDLYRFNLGDGQDVIQESPYNEGWGVVYAPTGTDILRFGLGVAPSDIQVIRVGNDLVFKHINGTDQVKVQNWFYASYYPLERMEFADGNAFNLSDLRLGTTNNDTLTGTSNDTIMMGDAGIDTLNGGAGNDLINGGSGADTMIGGTGNDNYVVDDVGDVITEALDEGTDTVFSSITYALGPNVENLTLIGTSAINGIGNALDNILTGNSGANVLTGGAGNDTYIIGPGDRVVENANEGIDTVKSSDTFTLPANVENLTLTGTANINATGNTLSNVLVGNSGANTLNGNTGSDTMSGGAGDDIYVVGNVGEIVTEALNEGSDTVQSSVTYILSANVENLTLTGTAAINGTGNALNNVLTGNSAANVLTGGAGNDTYIVGSGDTVVENANEGIDTIQSPITFTLPANVENLTLTGTSSINATGNDLNNTLTGNSGANTLNGSLGADTMIGGAGNDTYVVDNTGDIITENLNQGTDTVQSSITYTLGSNLENLTLTGTSAVNGTGNELNNVLTGNSAANVLTGNSGNDTLNGGAGADSLTGGLGNDTYVVDNPGDVVTEALNEGTDTVQSSITYTLNANVENLTLTGTSAINGTGNSLNNTLTGNSAANVLTGGLGNDTYVVGTGDTVVENLNEGTDTVQSSVTYTLGSNLENLTLTGTSAINGTGNELNNSITGNSASNILTGGLGNDTLNGSTGADTIIGGLGNDTYVVDNSGDVVTEALNEGTDTVQSSITYTLGANVENLTLTGSSAINSTGNTLDNILTGNSGVNVLTGGGGNDTLNGGTGADTLIGGLGNDTYVVDNTGDIVTENANEGTDTVQSSITYTLGSNLENLTLTGSSAINGTGNGLDNVLTGNSASNVLTGGAGNDTLNGGTGADTLIGGLGNDTYVVDNTGDVVTEALNEGTDTVQSSITYTLNANVENLTLAGTSAISGTGNTLDNMLTGNTGANTLTGGSGNDTLDGGAGNDTLKGETGNDLYLFARGYGSDTINDYDTTVGNSDKAKFNSGLNPLDLIFVNNGNDLKVQIYNASDLLTVQNQNLSSAYQVEVFEASDGRQLLSSKVSLLIQEMAGFSASTGMSWTQLIQNKPDDVQTILSHYWQPQQ